MRLEVTVSVSLSIVCKYLFFFQHHTRSKIQIGIVQLNEQNMLFMGGQRGPGTLARTPLCKLWMQKNDGYRKEDLPQRNLIEIGSSNLFINVIVANLPKLMQQVFNIGNSLCQLRLK